MQRITPWLWLALAGSVLQVVALVGPDFYMAQGERKDAWFGIPHASDLILLSALAAISMFTVTALRRNPVRGRSVGLIVGAVGLLATLQLGYRMVVPPFAGDVPSNPGIIGSGCLYYCPLRGRAGRPLDRDLDRLSWVPGGDARRVSSRLRPDRPGDAGQTLGGAGAERHQPLARPGSPGSTGPVRIRLHFLHLLHDHEGRRRSKLERLATDAPHQQFGPGDHPGGRRSGVDRGPWPGPTKPAVAGRATSSTGSRIGF